MNHVYPLYTRQNSQTDFLSTANKLTNRFLPALSNMLQSPWKVGCRKEGVEGIQGVDGAMPVPPRHNRGDSAIIMLERDSSCKDWFPRKLLEVLDDSEKYGFQHIISWFPDGKAFQVHDPALFTGVVMPKYFQNQTKYKSFQRQLNLYSFKPVNSQKGKIIRGASYHPLFRRDMPSLSYGITRSKMTAKTRRKLTAVSRDIGQPAPIQEEAVNRVFDSSTMSLDDTKGSFYIESKLSEFPPSSLEDSLYHVAGCLASNMMQPASNISAKETDVFSDVSRYPKMLYDFPAETAEEIINIFGGYSAYRDTSDCDAEDD